MNEQRNALEHIVRAKGRELLRTASDDDADEKYILGNLQKALGHEYRAYFDAADTISDELTVQIGRDLEPYSPVQISNIIKEYHDIMHVRLRQLRRAIATVRSKKDITQGTEPIEIEEYNRILTELLDFWETIGSAIPDLEKQRRIEEENQKRENARHGEVQRLTIRGQVIAIIAIVCTVFGVIISPYVTQLWSNDESTEREVTPEEAPIELEESSEAESEESVD